jgi:hypothetical protein
MDFRSALWDFFRPAGEFATLLGGYLRLYWQFIKSHQSITLFVTAFFVWALRYYIWVFGRFCWLCCEQLHITVTLLYSKHEVLAEMDNPSDRKLLKKNKGWWAKLWESKVKYKRKNEVEINYGLVSPVVAVKKSDEETSPKPNSKKPCVKQGSKKKR